MIFMLAELDDRLKSHYLVPEDCLRKSGCITNNSLSTNSKFQNFDGVMTPN